MKVLIVSISAIILAVANAASLPEASPENEVKLPSKLPTPDPLDSGLLMMGYVMKVIAQPTVTMAKLIREAFPDIEAGAKDAVQKLDHCLRDVNSRNVTVCAKFGAMTNECMEPVSEYYVKNLPENAKDIPKLITDSYSAIVHQVCNSRTEEFLELSNQCLFRPGTQEQRDIVKNTFEEKAKIFKAAPTKTNLCGIVNAVRPLIEAPVKSSCQSEITVKAIVDVFEASAKPCQV